MVFLERLIRYIKDHVKSREAEFATLIDIAGYIGRGSGLNSSSTAHRYDLPSKVF